MYILMGVSSHVILIVVTRILAYTNVFKFFSLQTAICMQLGYTISLYNSTLLHFVAVDIVFLPYNLPRYTFVFGYKLKLLATTMFPVITQIPTASQTVESIRSPLFSSQITSSKDTNILWVIKVDRLRLTSLILIDEIMRALQDKRASRSSIFESSITYLCPRYLDSNIVTTSCP